MADETKAPADAASAAAVVTPRDLVMQVVRAVAERHCLRVEELLMPDTEKGARQRARVNARHEAMVEVGRQFPKWSTPQIGALFGNRDHTTVLNARARHAEREAAKRGERGE